ncbi:MAG TPA: AAA family ATPase [Clostridia bacterium]|nr:AAA family ATPase [Clostridia bacterium]
MGLNFNTQISQIEDVIEKYLTGDENLRRSFMGKTGALDLVCYSIWDKVGNNYTNTQNVAVFLGHRGNTGQKRSSNGREIIENLRNTYNWFSNCKSLTLAQLESNLMNLTYKFENNTFTLDVEQRQGVKTVFDKLRNYKGATTMSGDSVKTIVVMDEIDKMIRHKHYQIILTGAPGTGKTHDAKGYAEKHGNVIGQAPDGKDKKYEFIQFHSSYDYTDFVEGIRPVDDGTGGMKFVKLDGIFKKFCRRVINLNKGEGSDVRDDGEGSKKLYYFLIDEINRADLGKVFGELMFGLEEDYRGVEHSFNTQYQNLPTYIYNDKLKKWDVLENDVFVNGFFIPKNICIIGTMNDIDRSVEAFDFALRRRFQWIDIKANEVMRYKLEDMRNNDSPAERDILVQRIIDLNKLISDAQWGGQFMLNEAFNIGPAYFREGNCDEIWEFRIQPILKEYCRSFMADEFIKACENVFKGNKKLVDYLIESDDIRD